MPSPAANLCEGWKGQRVTLVPPGSYKHLEMCQSLTLTAEATLGQSSAPQRHWLDITQLKIKMHLVKMEITVSRSMSHMLRNIGADRACGFVGYGMKLKWFMWTLDVSWRRDWQKKKKKQIIILSNHSLCIYEFGDLLKQTSAGCILANVDVQSSI